MTVTYLPGCNTVGLPSAQKIYDYQMQNENQRMTAHNNYSLNKQRADEKRKVQEAIF